MKEAQAYVQQFNDERDWSTPHSIKDLLLNMSEEVGEFWNIIKWVDTETQQRLLRENKDEAENFIGDMLYLIYKVAYLSGIDSEKGFNDVMAEYEKRFPIEQTKGNHANKRENPKITYPTIASQGIFSDFQDRFSGHFSVINASNGALNPTRNKLAGGIDLKEEVQRDGI